MPEIRFIDTSAEGLKRCAKLLCRAFPSTRHFTPSYLDWQYNRNPSGKAVGYNFYDRGALSAHYAAIPILAELNGKPCRGLLSLNTATLPEYRGKGLFTHLAKETYEHGLAAGYEFVVGVANANSTHGFTKRLGFQLVQPLLARLGIGSVKRRTRTCHIEFARVWTRDLLLWRIQNPNAHYRYTKRAQGYELVASTGRWGIGATLCEVPPDRFYGVDGLSPMRVPSPRLWMGIDPEIDWRRSLYMDVPSKLRPSPLNLIFKDLTGANQRLSPNSLIFQAVDFDAF